MSDGIYLTTETAWGDRTTYKRRSLEDARNSLRNLIVMANIEMVERSPVQPYKPEVYGFVLLTSFGMGRNLTACLTPEALLADVNGLSLGEGFMYVEFGQYTELPEGMRFPSMTVLRFLISDDESAVLSPQEAPEWLA